MSPRKRASKSPLRRGPLADLAKFLVGPGRTPVLALVIVAVFGGAWYWGWQQVRADVTASADYVLTPDDIVVTNRPKWMGFDIRTQVFHDPGLQQSLSIMDPDLTERVSAAFARHPWVAKVVRVRKQHPASVVVDLKYYEPVLMVHSPNQIIPVDVEGNQLPQWDIPLNEALRYPRLDRGDLPTPKGLVGDPWGDPRIVGAAQIAAALGDRWRSYRLERIEPIPEPMSALVADTIYYLHTQGGSIVEWGRAPGVDIPGEPSTEEKLAYLDKEIADYKTLEGPNGRARKIPLRFLIRDQRATEPK